ncbi:MAG TPA: hypothetical protein VGF42_07505 [Caulobacteraceae bacterium]
MITRLLIAGVAIGALSAAGASAHVRHHHARASTGAGAYAAPQQPIPYTQLDTYMKASPRERRAIEMAAANNSAATNASASVPAPAGSVTSPGADTSVPAATGANPTTGESGNPGPNNPSDQVQSTGPDNQGNPVATPPPNPNPPPH